MFLDQNWNQNLANGQHCCHMDSSLPPWFPCLRLALRLASAAARMNLSRWKIEPVELERPCHCDTCLVDHVNGWTHMPGRVQDAVGWGVYYNTLHKCEGPLLHLAPSAASLYPDGLLTQNISGLQLDSKQYPQACKYAGVPSFCP